jgi:hypothetical protein
MTRTASLHPICKQLLAENREPIESIFRIPYFASPSGGGDGLRAAFAEAVGWCLRSITMERLVP